MEEAADLADALFHVALELSRRFLEVPLALVDDSGVVMRHEILRRQETALLEVLQRPVELAPQLDCTACRGPVVEPAAVLATHLSEIIRSHADELLSRQDVKDVCESVREFAPALVEDIIPDKVSINTLHNVLRMLLHERIPIKDIVTILETLANFSGTGAGIDQLTEKVREALRRTISALYTETDGKIHVVSLHPETEQNLLQACRDSEQAGSVVLDPNFTQEFLGKLDGVLRAAYSKGRPPVLLVPTPLRFFMKRFIEPTYPNLAVMGYTEVASAAQIQAAGTVVTHGFRMEKQATHA